MGDEDADLKVARVVAVDADGNIELEVLPGSIESHVDLLAPVSPVTHDSSSGQPQAIRTTSATSTR